MPSTISGNLPSYSDHPTSIPPSRTSRSLLKNHTNGLELPTPLTHSEWVVQHIPRYGPPELSIADSPLAESLPWVQSQEPKPVPRLSLREARACQAASLETKSTSAGTVMHSECLLTPPGSGSLREPKPRVPRPLEAPLPEMPESPDPLVPLVVTHLWVSTIHIESWSVTRALHALVWILSLSHLLLLYKVQFMVFTASN